MNFTKPKAQARWPQRLRLIRAISRAEVDVIGAQLCSMSTVWALALVPGQSFRILKSIQHTDVNTSNTIQNLTREKKLGVAPLKSKTGRGPQKKTGRQKPGGNLCWTSWDYSSGWYLWIADNTQRDSRFQFECTDFEHLVILHPNSDCLSGTRILEVVSFHPT